MKPSLILLFWLLLISLSCVHLPKTETEQGIDLNHHLIPDPVAEAVSCLLERIHVLERQAGIERVSSAEANGEGCESCDGHPVCEPVKPHTRMN